MLKKKKVSENLCDTKFKFINYNLFQYLCIRDTWKGKILGIFRAQKNDALFSHIYSRPHYEFNEWILP